MSEPFDQTENDLVALLDEALAAFKGDRAFDFEAWRQCHGRELAEAPALLATLRQLAESTHGWKQLLLPGRPSEDTASYCRNGPPVRPAPANIGRYYILGELGSGGMGVVYKAHDPQLDRVVAVKVPNLQHAKTEPAVTLQRFLREARAAAAVRHPHICPIYDVGEQASVPYVVMAYVRGGSLAQCLRRGRFQDVRQAVALARQVAEALVVIHGQGIIHRDLKPGNILLDDRGEALITDFGLSRLVEDRDHLTRSGMILGTPAYMAPEAVVEGCAGPATDVYSLGAVLYQMLTGVPPCEEGSQALLNAALAPEVPPPSRLRAEVDPALEASF